MTWEPLAFGYVVMAIIASGTVTVHIAEQWAKHVRTLEQEWANAASNRAWDEADRKKGNGDQVAEETIAPPAEVEPAQDPNVDPGTVVDQIDEALAELRLAQSIVRASMEEKAGTASALAEAQAALVNAQAVDAAAAMALAQVAAERDSKKASLKVLVDHMFVGGNG